LAQEPLAQKEFYERFSPKMLAVCMRYVGQLPQAEDLLIEGFLKAFKSLGSYKSQGSLEAWLRRIFINTALDFLRKNKKDILSNALKNSTHEFIISADDHAAAAEFEFEPNAACSLDLILACVSELPEPQALVFNLYVLDGYSHQEISDFLGMSVANSKSILHRSRKQLKEALIQLKTNAYEKVRI